MHMRQKTKEEYIETIYQLEQREGRAQTGMIAEAIDVKPPSVTEMLRKLEKEGLVRYESYAGATLTTPGKAMAKELMKRHRIFADLLELLGVGRETAEVDACQIEHHVSAETVEQLELFLRFLRHDAIGQRTLEMFEEYRSERGQ
jgi:DtxR family Mn-dependent transcriptional regulator